MVSVVLLVVVVMWVFFCRLVVCIWVVRVLVMVVVKLGSLFRVLVSFLRVFRVVGEELISLVMVVLSFVWLMVESRVWMWFVGVFF